MKRRRRLWLALVLLLFVAASFMLPAVRWRVIGWVKGEAFYEGRPTSYWANEIDEWLTFQALGQSASWSERFFKAVGLDYQRRRPEPVVLGPLFELSKHDGPARDLYRPINAAAIPVLVDLLKDRRESVRQKAVSAFFFASDQGDPAIRVAVIAALGDESELVRESAVWALRWIDPEAAAKAGVK
jgi:hypothetical protein